jgi:uncharacterized membrane protein
MNWKLLFTLSLFALGMALATVYLIPTKLEGPFWFIIFGVCGYFIAKRCNSRYFLHGFVLSLINCFWITSIHTLLYADYMAHHADMSTMAESMHMGTHPRMAMVVFGPVIGIVSGLVQGLFAFVASKLVKKS